MSSPPLVDTQVVNSATHNVAVVVDVEGYPNEGMKRSINHQNRCTLQDRVGCNKNNNRILNIV